MATSHNISNADYAKAELLCRRLLATAGKHTDFRAAIGQAMGHDDCLGLVKELRDLFGTGVANHVLNQLIERVAEMLRSSVDYSLRLAEPVLREQQEQ